MEKIIPALSESNISPVKLCLGWRIFKPQLKLIMHGQLTIYEVSNSLTSY